MAVAASREEPYWVSQRLPYGAAALVTVAAILSAWPLYLESSFPYLALGLVVIGTPASMYFRAAGVNRRLLNMSIVGVSLVFIFSMLTRMQLPGTGDLFRYAMSVDDRAAVAFVIQMFVIVAMFRSFSLLTDRDLTLTIVPALSIILLSSIVVPGPGVVISLIAFLLGALYLLAFDHQQTEAQRAQAGRLLAPGLRRSLLAASIAAAGAILVPAMLVATIAFGWINLPRAVMLRYRNYVPYVITSRILQIAAPAWIVPSESIVLGSGLPQRSNVVFLAESRESALWRATTLDTYDGRGWANKGRAHRRDRLRFEGDSWLAPSKDPGIRAGVPTSPLKQTFHLEVPMQGILITAYEPQALKGPLTRPRVSDSSVLTNITPLRGGAVYRAVSLRKAAPGAAAYRPGVTLSEAERKRYLQLPEITYRTRRLARQIAAGERDDLHRALALRAYLGTKYVYHPRVSPPRGNVDYVDYFLFNMDGAYCDYFASAMAVLARVNGIPARVVTGFASDEEDEETGWWLVREKHAHSWTEVFIEGYGWLELDPSPAAGSEPSLLERAQKGWTAVARRLKTWALAPWRALVAIPGWRWKVPAAAAALAALVLAIAYLRRAKVPPLPRGGDGRQFREYVRRCYDRMCRWLEAWGMPKPPGATASEYALSLAQAVGAEAAPMREIIGAYLMAEYSGHQTGLAEARGVAERLRAVLAMRRLLRRRRAE